MSRILITRPEHDPLTKYLSCWNSKVIELASNKGHIVTDLHKEKANRKEFEGRMKKLNPSLVLLNGHGDNESVTGHDNAKNLYWNMAHQVCLGNGRAKL